MLSSCRSELLAALGCVDDPEVCTVQIVWGVCDVRGGSVDGDPTLGQIAANMSWRKGGKGRCNWQCF